MFLINPKSPLLPCRSELRIRLLIRIPTSNRSISTNRCNPCNHNCNFYPINTLNHVQHALHISIAIANFTTSDSDYREHVLETTLWQNGLFELDMEKAIGKVLTITSSLVIEHEGVLQLETTPATTISLNPNFPDLHKYIEKYCVNTAIADQTASANVVFFDDAMTSIIQTSCVEMVVDKARDHYCFPLESDSPVKRTDAQDRTEE
ncbi:hypothetical protein SSX86_008295 [Deinandra increscens subsp. villosa]|uniref:Uncharacterized protein n=1 Tax=Deinandra increscens subsp. villosa TaxID=3103831 RepID=A0AAP0H6P4_9ASTR